MPGREINNGYIVGYKTNSCCVPFSLTIMSSPHKTGRKLTRGAKMVAAMLKNAAYEIPEPEPPVTVIITKKCVVLVDSSEDNFDEDESEASESEYIPSVKRAQALLSSPFSKEDLLPNTTNVSAQIQYLPTQRRP